MAVARESIVAALREMEELEKSSLANLVQVSRNLPGLFPTPQGSRISSLLGRLKEETSEHESLVHKVIDRLRRCESG